MIFTRHSVLKRGCSTWDREAMPEEEFRRRLDGVRREMARQNLDALVIYGDNYSFGDLCYLTNYFPKVRGGIALVPREQDISLLLNIGSRDVPFAKTLTWVADVRASNQVGRDGAELLKEKGLGAGTIGLVDSGKGFPLPQLEEMKNAVPEVQWRDCDSLLNGRRVQKGPREVAALRGAGRTLNRICTEAQAFIREGRREYEVVADIDRLARDQGVEDVRIAAGCGRLNPPSSNMTGPVADHWAVHLAIQHERYWVEAGRTYLSLNSRLQALYKKAQEVLAAMAAQLKPGNPVQSIDETARAQLGEFYARAALYGHGNGIGLSPWESPFLSEAEARQMGNAFAPSTAFEENMTLTLRVAFPSEGKLILFGDSFYVTPEGPESLIMDNG